MIMLHKMQSNNHQCWVDKESPLKVGRMSVHDGEVEYIRSWKCRKWCSPTTKGKRKGGWAFIFWWVCKTFTHWSPIRSGITFCCTLGASISKIQSHLVVTHIHSHGWETIERKELTWQSQLTWGRNSCVKRLINQFERKELTWQSEPDTNSHSHFLSIVYGLMKRSIYPDMWHVPCERRKDSQKTLPHMQCPESFLCPWSFTLRLHVSLNRLFHMITFENT